ncbi:MAG: hypothetical protein ACREBE_16350 [bacterium]
MYVRYMAHGSHGPNHADVRSMQRALHESSSPFHAEQMARAFAALLRDTHRLGGLAKGSAEYRRQRERVAGDRTAYVAARDAWVDALVRERGTSYRIDVSRKLTEILAGELANRRDDPLQPISTAIRRAIDWMAHPDG